MRRMGYFAFKSILGRKRGPFAFGNPGGICRRLLFNNSKPQHQACPPPLKKRLIGGRGPHIRWGMDKEGIEGYDEKAVTLQRWCSNRRGDSRQLSPGKKTKKIKVSERTKRERGRREIQTAE